MSTETPEADGEEWTYVTDLKVSSGRLFIRDRAQDRHGIAEKDVLIAELETDNGESVKLGEVIVADQGRIQVPQNVRSLYDLDGEYVDLKFIDTGRSVE